MRIVQVHNSYRDRGGEDIQVETEAQALRSAGHELIEVRTRNPSRPAASALALARAPHNGSAARRALASALEPGPDLVHLHNTWFQLSPAVFEQTARTGAPMVLTLHNYRLVCVQAMLFRDGRICNDCVGRRPLPGVVHRCYRGSLVPSALAAATIELGRARGSWELVDRLVAPSATLKRTYVEAGFAEDRLRVVPNMVADPGPRSRPPSASRTVLFVGRLTPEKGVDLILDAWQRHAAGPDLRLELIGDGPLRPELERRLPEGARLLGWRSEAEVREAMLDARAVLVPTRCLEPFGRGAAEALAAGAPVIGSSLGGTGEIISELGREWTVESEDPQAWRAALRLLDDDGLLDEAAARGRGIYERRFSTEAVREQLERVYREAIGRGR